jgi:hypothetical protein
MQRHRHCRQVARKSRGNRAGAVCPPDAATKTIVEDNSSPVSQPRTGDIIKVHLAYTFTPIVPILSQITAAFNLTADEEVRIE